MEESIREIYYKITNETECHNGYQYVDGLNILDKKFEPVGSCVASGLYFTTAKYIFKYLDHGCYLREVTLPVDCQFVRDPSGNNFRADKIILGKKYNLTDISTYQMLLKNGADIHVDHDNALRWASQKGYLDIVIFLVENGANIRADDTDALKVASRGGHLSVIEYLIKNGANINIANDYALRWSSLCGRLEIVKYLVENGANVCSIDSSALIWAAENGHLQVVDFLVKNGANIHADNNCALRIAAENGHLPVVQYLVENGADIHADNDNAMKISLKNKHTNIVKYLGQFNGEIAIVGTQSHNNFLTNTIEVYYKITNETECHNGYQYKDGLNVLDKKFDPVGSCAVGGLYFTTAKYIFKYLDYGCYLREVTLPNDCQCVLDPSGNKFRADRIILGKKYNLTDIVTFKLLLEKGADIHVDDDYALRWASKNGHFDIVKFLVENGADVHAWNNHALRLASENGHFDIVKYLVENGADIHANYDYALMVVAGAGCLPIVQYLVQSGANIHANDNAALRYASLNKHFDVVKFLSKKEYSDNGNYYSLKKVFEKGHMEVTKFSEIVEYLSQN